MSCCGRGGSWFKNCGSSGNTKLQHTWYEGIQACKARSQSKTVVGHQLNVDLQKGIPSSQGTGVANYEAVITANKTFGVMSANTPTKMADTTSIVTLAYTPDNVSTHRTSASTSITTQGSANVLKITVHINLLFIIIVY